ncbi:MAG: hypothetical protein CVV27_18455 [Candidatus Melainabacteria bacterium HGW-Melainabacteria-1]|nr:MAG: hypothetical protein CVV27_18455 [Candidatus Melainabacteria bacterium HGW-Melainabacteria-1]
MTEWDASWYRRLEDRGHRRQRPHPEKQVYRALDTGCILLRFGLPMGQRALRRTLQGAVACAAHQPLRILDVEEVGTWETRVKVSDAGNSLKDLLASAALKPAQILACIEGLQQTMPADKGLVRNVHPYLELFLSRPAHDQGPLASRLTRLVRKICGRPPDQTLLRPGVLDPKLANFCLSSAGEVSLVDFDHFSLQMPEDLTRGFVLADLLCEARFELSPTAVTQADLIRDRHWFVQGMLARLVFEFVDPLIFVSDDLAQQRGMAEILGWIEALPD